MPPSYEEIETLAYEHWEERGRPWGTPETDWFRAEKELDDGVLSKVARGVGAVVGSAISLLSELDPTKQEES